MAYKYTPRRGASPSVTRRDIEDEFRKWNIQAGDRIITDYDLPMQRSNQRESSVVFLMRGARINVRIDAWEDFGTNLRCCYLNIRDMRLAEARGSLSSLRESLMALPAGKTERDSWEIMQLQRGAPSEMVDAAYRTLAKKLHPDVQGGDAAAFRELDEAYKKLKGAS
jgi:hypothetical protein